MRKICPVIQSPNFSQVFMIGDVRSMQAQCPLHARSMHAPCKYSAGAIRGGNCHAWERICAQARQNGRIETCRGDLWPPPSHSKGGGGGEGSLTATIYCADFWFLFLKYQETKLSAAFYSLAIYCVSGKYELLFIFLFGTCFGCFMCNFMFRPCMFIYTRKFGTTDPICPMND
jgi:hypothetical protein